MDARPRARGLQPGVPRAPSVPTRSGVTKWLVGSYLRVDRTNDWVDGVDTWLMTGVNDGVESGV